MKPAYLLLAVISIALIMPSEASAQRRRGGGVVQGPFGPLYDTRSPEWRMSGGNFFVYQQLMEEKMWRLQQQQELQQMQRLQKQQKAASQIKKAPGLSPDLNGTNSFVNGGQSVRRRKKLRASAKNVAVSGSSRTKAPDSGSIPAVGTSGRSRASKIPSAPKVPLGEKAVNPASEKD